MNIYDEGGLIIPVFYENEPQMDNGKELVHINKHDKEGLIIPIIYDDESKMDIQNELIQAVSYDDKPEVKTKESKPANEANDTVEIREQTDNFTAEDIMGNILEKLQPTSQTIYRGGKSNITHEDNISQEEKFRISNITQQPVIQEQIPAALGSLHVSKEKPPSGSLIAEKIASYGYVRIFEERIFMYVNGRYKKLTDREINRMIRDLCRFEVDKAGRKSIFEDTKAFLLADSRLQAQPLDPRRFICLSNGVYDLQQSVLYEHSREYFITHALNIPFLPEASDTRTFDMFLHTAMNGNHMLIKRIWQSIGYLLTADCSAKVFFVLQGVSDSGKSVLLEVIRSMFFKDSVSNLDIYRLGDRFSSSALIGKSINIAGDLPDMELRTQAVATIKMLTGRDEIAVEEKYQPITMLAPAVKFVFATNFAFRMSSRDDALLKRLILIPFSYAVPREMQDKNLTSKILSERPAIFIKALGEYRGLVRDRYQFAAQAEVEMSSNVQICLHTSDNSVVEQFIGSCCFFNRPDAYTSTPALHTAYLQFCAQVGLPEITNSASFSRIFGQCCGNKVTKKKKRIGEDTQNGYLGVYILNDNPVF